MGQKVHPVSFRLGINKTWDSKWFANKEYSNFIFEDFNIRKFLKKKVRIRIYAARPGIIIGKKGVEIERLKTDLEKTIKRDVILDIQEVRKAEVDAQLVAENVAMQLVRRIAFRRAMKKSVTSALRFGAQGIKISCSGRLGGAEMARREWYREGRVPLHTIRADIDYGFAEAFTTYGVIGVKVIIFKGEILPNKNKKGVG